MVFWLGTASGNGETPLPRLGAELPEPSHMRTPDPDLLPAFAEVTATQETSSHTVRVVGVNLENGASEAGHHDGGEKVDLGHGFECAIDDLGRTGRVRGETLVATDVGELEGDPEPGNRLIDAYRPRVPGSVFP